MKKYEVVGKTKREIIEYTQLKIIYSNKNYTECTFIENKNYDHRTLYNIKFVSCVFKETLTVLGEIENCEFINCTFEKGFHLNLGTKDFQRPILKRVPEWIFDHPITKLTLANNEINSLPKRFSEMKHLRELNISFNKFKMLNVENLVGLEKLHTLLARSNSIFDVNKSISKTSIKFLDLSNNFIRTGVDAVLNMKNVEKINLAHNNIQKLMTKIKLSNKIEYLNLQDNSIKSIPDSFANLKNLEVFNISYNDIKLMNKPFFGMTGLRLFMISYNKLKTVPKDIHKLIVLREMYFDGNEFEKFPVHLLEKDFDILSFLSNPMKVLSKKVKSYLKKQGVPPKLVIEEDI